MSAFIAKMIENEARYSIERGKVKYKAYFVNTNLYLNWKSEVDTILETDGYTEVII